MSYVRIEQWDHAHKSWVPLAFSQIKFDIESMLIGGRFRILVDGKPVYESGEAKP